MGLYDFSSTGGLGMKPQDLLASFDGWGAPANPDYGQGLTAPGSAGYTTSATLAQFPQFGQWGSPSASLPTANRGFLDGMMGGVNKDGTRFDGWGGMALGVGQAGLGAFLGMKQYGLAKQTLEQNKRQFQLNYDAQKQTTNTRLEDRQRARVANNASSVGVDDYMNKNRIA